MNDKLLIDRTLLEQALDALLHRRSGSDQVQRIDAAITDLCAALAQQPEPVQEPLVWEPVVRDLPALTQREYDALHKDLRWNYKKITQPKPEPVCKCDLRTRLVGDGCEVCNPELAAEFAQQPEPAQEPVAWMVEGSLYASKEVAQKMGGNAYTLQALYTAPPQQPEPAQDERTTIADLRCAKWLDPECADKGACQSLKFKRPAEPVQEPAYLEVRCPAHPTWMRVDEQQFVEYVSYGWEGRKLYATPPQRPPLTDEEIAEATAGVLGLPHEIKVELARAIERKVRGEA